MGFWLSTKTANMILLLQIQMSRSSAPQQFAYGIQMVYIHRAKCLFAEIWKLCEGG